MNICFSAIKLFSKRVVKCPLFLDQICLGQTRFHTILLLLHHYHHHHHLFSFFFNLLLLAKFSQRGLLAKTMTRKNILWSKHLINFSFIVIDFFKSSILSTVPFRQLNALTIANNNNKHIFHRITFE